MEPWKYKELGEVFEINTKSINPQMIAEELIHYSLPAFDSIKLPIIQPSRDILSNKTVIDRETLLVSKLNPRISRIWLVKEIDERLKSVSSTEFINYVSKENVNLDFYYQYFKSEFFQDELLALESGTTGSRKRVTPKDTLKLKLPIPTIQEQQKIASILSTVDEQIDQTEQLIVKTKELKEGLMQQLLTKGIGHTEFKQSELGEIPVEWEIKRIGDFVSEFRGGASIKPNDYSSVGIKVLPKKIVDDYSEQMLDNLDRISSERIEDFKNSKVNSKYLITSLRDLVPSAPSLGKIIKLKVDEQNEFLLAQGVYGFLIDNDLNANFLMQISYTKKYRKKIQELKVGSTQVHMRQGDFLGLTIPYPPLKEQQKIASILSTVDEQIGSYEKEKVKYGELKKGLMQQLLTGKARVKVD